MSDIDALIAEAREMIRFPRTHFHYSDGPKCVSGLIDALTAERDLSDRMREAMRAAREQFRFYENEYLKAGMTAQAATNAGHAYRLDRFLQGDAK